MDIFRFSNFVTWEYWIVSWWCNTCIWQSSRPPTILKPGTKAAEQHHFIRTKFYWPYIAGWNHWIFFVRAYRGWSNPITAVWFGFSWCIDCMRTFNRCLMVAGDLESSRSIGSIAKISWPGGMCYDCEWNTAQDDEFVSCNHFSSSIKTVSSTFLM